MRLSIQHRERPGTEQLVAVARVYHQKLAIEKEVFCPNNQMHFPCAVPVSADKS